MTKTELIRERLSIVYCSEQFQPATIGRYPDLPGDISLISFDTTSALGRLVRNHNRKYGIPIRIETNSLRYLLDATARGLGITILPEHLPIDGTANLARFLSPALDTVRGNVIIQRRRPGLSNQAESFLSELIKSVRKRTDAQYRLSSTVERS
jgi:DNA-binding transcriptional LysR family regulator